MENLYIILVVVLFALAISDLIVGVSNDAVNFLNSAIGSKAAPFKLIMIIAAIGIIVGATFSTGMMEVARKGIFHPENFFFSEIMIIFLAVMITDVILLDLFNTFGMPTSTTVSIVFELLGGAVAVALIKVSNDSQIVVDGVSRLGEMADYINSERALLIISGILLSVVIAFTVGAIVQWITRLIFSFRYKKSLRYYGAIFGGIAITSITYFILIKGLKGSTYASYELSNGEILKDWVKNNTGQILLVSFLGWAILLQILQWIFKLNILKTIVLVGTFALAMAFAGNDLVNFIGVPLAGYESFKAFIAEPGANPDLFSMAVLQGKVKTPTLFLLIAGLIMVVTLWTSKKARSVVKTELNLSRQDEGSERFGSSFLARSLVRSSSNFSSGISRIIPSGITKGVSKKFDSSSFNEYQRSLGNNAPEFDMLRASVNLVVASILISLATSMKLPLSTTYVTFMVAMGTSLADNAWGRESAVYRITGVLSVIGGWFLTAFSAFTVAFVMANLISYGGIYAIVVLILIALFVVYRTHIIHKRKTKKAKKISELSEETEIKDESMLQRCTNNIIETLGSISTLYNSTLEGLINFDRKKLKSADKAVLELNKEAKLLKDNIPGTIRKLRLDSVETGYYYVQVLDYLREIAHCLTFISKPAFTHIDNNHKPLINIQKEELKELSLKMSELILLVIEILKTCNFDKINDAINIQQELLNLNDNLRKAQLKRIKKDGASTKTSLVYIGILHESHSIVLYVINLIKSHRDFISLTNSNS